MNSHHSRSLFFVLVMLLCLVLFAAACGDDDDDDNNDTAAAADDDDDDDDASPADDDDDDNNDDDNDDDTTPPDEITITQEGDDLVIQNGLVAVRYHLMPGRYSVLNDTGHAVIDHAEATVWTRVILPQQQWPTTELPFVAWAEATAENVLGTGKSITVTRGGGDAPTVHQIFTLLEGQTVVLSDVEIENTTGDDIEIGAVYPLLAEGADGALAMGNERDLRILTDGTLNYLEFLALLWPGNIPTFSNWNALIYNQEVGSSLALGYLSFDVAQPVFYYAPGRDKGRQTLHVDAEFDPPKTVADGDTLATETFALDFGQATPHEALELYADRVHDWMDIDLWTDRHPEIGIPVGWNSWSGSGSSGGYGTDITEELMVENMDFADRELRRWGMNYFQIDDGWEPKVGDWQIDETKFPPHGDQNGIEWLLSRGKDMGFQVGLWIAAFNASHQAQIVQDHPEYWAPPMLGWLFERDEEYMDLTLPAARAHLVDVLENLLDWGVQWIKLDFQYWAATTEDWHDDTLTRGEFYRTGMQLMRDTLGDDVFFLAVAIVGWDIGVVDSVRLTLDTMPSWEGEKPNDPFGNQGLKPMYRDSARKYYFHDRVFVNHPDLIFFRPHKDTQFVPLTLNESLTFATSVAMQAGLVKIGDRIAELQPEWVDGYRRIMPVYPGKPRPLDLFERSLPEVWSMPVPDFDEPYHVIGLLNWGTNQDLTQLPFAAMPDDARILSADLAAGDVDPQTQFHAFEYWTQEYLGVMSGTVSLEVPARHPRVVGLHPVLDRPQFLGTNRHVLGGAVVVHSLAWNDQADEYTIALEGSVGTTFAPFEHRLTFFVPDGYTLQDVTADVPAGFAIVGQDLQVDGNIATLAFTVADNNPDPAQWHPEISWTLEF
jgi:Melibiase